MSLILAVNTGSSSLKISLYKRSALPYEHIKLLLVCNISNIFSPPATFAFNGENEDLPESAINDHASAFAHFLKRLNEHERKEIRHICHRVVHGGDFTNHVVIDNESYHHLEILSDLAPLHNGAALSVVKACIKQLPKAKSIAYFDTAFHRSIPPHIASYAIDQTTATRKGLKKYGFHGLSCQCLSTHLEKPTLIKRSRCVYSSCRFDLPRKACFFSKSHCSAPRFWRVCVRNSTGPIARYFHGTHAS